MPAALVEGGTRRWGRLDARPDAVNPLDAYGSRPRRLLGWLRLKEWLGWTLLHPEISSSFILQDAHYLASSEIYVRDRAGLAEHARNARGGSLHLPRRLYPSSQRFSAPGYEIAYAWSDGPTGTHRIHVDVAEREEQPAIAIDLTLDGSRASAPLSVSAPLPGGTLYTHKRIFPAAGHLRVGERRYTFDPGRDLAILDEHKSRLPYRTRWLWGTFAGLTPDGILGANVAERPTAPGGEEESCLWTPDACEPLADITFTPSGDDPLAPWHIGSADGRLDVRFEPEDRKSVEHQLVVAAIDYWQLVGKRTPARSPAAPSSDRAVCSSGWSPGSEKLMGWEADQGFGAVPTHQFFCAQARSRPG